MTVIFSWSNLICTTPWAWGLCSFTIPLGCQELAGNFDLFHISLTKLFSSFTLKCISAFNALNTRKTVSIVALFALLSSLEI
jgi:hypothetical protein